jgi:multidrug resistance protein
MSEPVSPSRVRGIVLLTVFLDVLGFGLLIPVQPFFAEQLGARPAVVTLLGTAYSIMQVIFTPMWGRLSDRWGRRPILLISIAAACAGWLVFAHAESLPWLFAARALAGFGNANIATAQATLADTSAPGERAKAMGLVGMAMGMGFLLGPVLGGILGQWGYRAPALVAAGLAALNWVQCLLLLPETHPKERRGRGSLRHPLHPKELAQALAWPGAGRLLLVSLVITAAFALMEADLSLFVERVWVPEGLVVGATAQVVTAAHERAGLLTAALLLVVGITSGIVQGGLIGRLVARWGEPRLLRWGAALMGLGLALAPVAGLGPFATMFIPILVMAAGSSLVNPSLSSLLSRLAPAHEQGRILGLGASVTSLGRVLGPGFAGRLLEMGTAVPFVVGAVGLFFAAFLARPVRVSDAGALA